MAESPEPAPARLPPWLLGLLASLVTLILGFALNRLASNLDILEGRLKQVEVQLHTETAERLQLDKRLTQFSAQLDALGTLAHRIEVSLHALDIQRHHQEQQLTQISTNLRELLRRLLPEQGGTP